VKQVLSFTLKNVVYFKEATLKVSEHPLTFVRGLNFDSLDLHSGAITGNGVGKSLLMSALSLIFYFSPINSLRKLGSKRGAKKEVLGKDSLIECEMLDDQGVHYRIQQFHNKYVIFKNGKDMEFKTIPAAEAFIRKLFPMPEVEFYTSCYMSTAKPHPFQMSSDTERLEYLSTIFGLNDYDRIRKYFQTKLASIKDIETKLSVLTQEKSDIEKKLKTINVNKIQDTDELESERDSLNKSLAKITQKEFDLSSQLRSIKQLSNIEKVLDELRSKYKHKEKPKERIVFLKTARKSIEKYSTYLKLKKAYDNSTLKIKLELEALEKEVSNKSLAELKKEKDNIQSFINKWSDSIEKLKQELEEQSNIKVKLKKLKVDKPDMRNLSEEIAQHKTTLKFEKLLNNIDHDHSTSKCPTCMSKINVDEIKSLVNKARYKLKELEELKEQQTKWQAYKELKKELKDIDSSLLTELQSKVSNAQLKIKAITKQIEVLNKQKHLKDALKEIDKPEKVDKPELDISIEELEEELELCQTIQEKLSEKHSLIHSNRFLESIKTHKFVQKEYESKNIELKTLLKKKKKLEQKTVNLNKQIEEISSEKTKYTLYKDQLKSLNKSIDKYKPTLENKKLIEALIKAYSSKGLKSIAANEICGLLEQNLNAYRSFAFAEPFTFSVSCSNSGMSILVDRGKNKISDVRKLSGAESDSFRLLFVMALLPLIPDDRRTNFLVLDEPCSHQDEILRSKIIDVYLPQLMTIVPNIFVITPNPSDTVEGSRTIFVQKKNGTSKVLKSSLQLVA